MSNPLSPGKHTFGATALVLLAVLFLALTVLCTFLFRGWRIDLTENRLYTIAPGTERILAGLDEPIHLYFFFSQEPSKSVPAIRAYAQRVRELLEEMAQRSGGRLKLTVIDPQPFTEDEDRAGEFGLTSVPIGANGESLYFGLAGTNSTDGRQTIGFFQPDKEEFLEYDVASLVYRLAHPQRPVVGLMSGLEIQGGFDPMSGQMRPGWTIMSQLHELFDVRPVAPEATRIEDEVTTLLLVHPKNLSPATLYAIDQFVLRGGRLLAFVDPQSEQDGAGAMPDAQVTRSSDLAPLFTAWGIEYDSSRIVADRELALSVSMRAGAAPSRHLAVLALGRDNFNASDVLTAALDSINMMTVGSLSAKQEAGIEFEPLLQTSTQAAQLGAERFASFDDPQSLLDGFKPSGEAYTLAARIRGKLKTAYPDGPPANVTTDTAQLKESTGQANLIVVADTDMLSDPLWLRSENLFGQRYAVAWANNGDFAANALDNLAGSSDLISVRGRQSFFRPFSRVDELRQQADEQLRVKEQELNRELQDTERRLSELEAGRDQQSNQLFTPEQEAELLRFQEQRSRIRKELREVRRSLDVEIDRLGTALKALNIVLLPALIAVAALLIALRRRRRLGSDRSTAGAAA